MEKCRTLMALGKFGLMLMETYGSPQVQQAQSRVQQGQRMVVPIGMSRILELENIQTDIQGERKNEVYAFQRN